MSCWLSSFQFLQANIFGSSSTMFFCPFQKFGQIRNFYGTFPLFFCNDTEITSARASSRQKPICCIFTQIRVKAIVRVNMLNLCRQWISARRIIIAGSAFYYFAGAYRMWIIWCKGKYFAHIYLVRRIYPTQSTDHTILPYRPAVYATLTASWVVSLESGDYQHLSVLFSLLPRLNSKLTVQRFSDFFG